MSKYRVLIVDDEDDLRKIERMALSPRFEVFDAFDGLDALEKLEWVEPDFVVLDVAMPLMSGIEACKAIRNHPGFRDLPVLFLSVMGQKDTVKSAYTSGANLYITKPFDPETLADTIGEFLQKAGVEPRDKHFSIQELEERYSSRAPTPVPVEGQAAPSTIPDSGKPAAITPRVMVVDDDSGMVDLLTATLKQDFEVVSARDGIEAIEKIIIYQPDVILLDAMMPGKSGYQLCESIRRNRRYRKTPIVFVSAKASPRDRERCLKLGANDFVAKPFDPMELRDKVVEITRSPGFVVHSKKLTTDISYPGSSADGG